MTEYNTTPPRPWRLVESVPLSRAQLCEDCHMITAANNCHCLVCGSKAVMLLAKVLGK